MNMAPAQGTGRGLLSSIRSAFSARRKKADSPVQQQQQVSDNNSKGTFVMWSTNDNNN